jgi:sugar phosphate isomerase/epimerase
MKLDQVAVQMYTLRDHMKTAEDYDNTLAKVAAIGYRSVQISGPRPITPAEIRKLCDKHGLSINSTHEDSNTILNNPQQVVENLKAFGCKYTAYPYPRDVDFNSLDSIDSLIAKLDDAGRVLTEAGMVLTYHNHNHEFRKIKGEIILERIYNRTDPKRVQGEIDTFWVQAGGGDPTTWCRKLNNRLPLLHLKDFMVNEENKGVFCEIGNGVLDFKGIISAAEESGCEWFIVEQDVCPGDPFDSLTQSFNYIRAHLVQN